MFRKMRGIALPYRVQGLIFFTCQCYDILPPRQQKKIDDTIAQVCGDTYSEALKAVLTTSRSVCAIALDHYVSETTLYRLREKFYLEYWGEKSDAKP